MFKRTEVIKFSDFMGKKPSNEVDFFIQDLEQEVIHLPENITDTKKVQQFILKTGMTFNSFLAMSVPVGAQGTALPTEWNDIMVQVQVACIGISGSLAIMCLMAAGICRMLKLENVYKDWTKEIYKGLFQIITAPVAVAVFVMIVQLVLRLFPGNPS